MSQHPLEAVRAGLLLYGGRPAKDWSWDSAKEARQTRRNAEKHRQWVEERRRKAIVAELQEFGIEL